MGTKQSYVVVDTVKALKTKQKQPSSKTKMRINKKLINQVVTELVGQEAMVLIDYLRGKEHISEFIIAEETELEIHKVRNILYRLLEHNLVYFHRKKDKIKGWYICYWDFNEPVIPELFIKIKEEKIRKARERLVREENNFFFLCRNACARMDFEKAIDFNYKCPECNEIMQEQDNQRTIEFLKERINELETIS
tara:strand:+ start:34 stop:615 length:582 start_codon:yes stop_codon:yes gene_type:complete